jgi:hypothetical protein
LASGGARARPDGRGDEQRRGHVSQDAGLTFEVTIWWFGDAAALRKPKTQTQIRGLRHPKEEEGNIKPPLAKSARTRVGVKVLSLIFG